MKKFKDLTAEQKGQALNNLTLTGITLEELNEFKVWELFPFASSKEGSAYWIEVINDVKL